MSSDRFIKPWLPLPQQKYVFHNASLIDPVTGTISSKTVTLAGGVVASIDDPFDEALEDSVDTIDVDAKGKYLCPGLIDCHVHICAVPGEKDLGKIWSIVDSDISKYRHAWVLKAALERGFTTLRDTGGANLALKEAVAEGVFPGPRIFFAGKALSQSGGHGDLRSAHAHSECCPGGLAQICDGVPQCLKAAREQLRQGADFIKIMTGGGVASPTDKLEHLQFSAEEIKAITTVASNAGTYVTAHAYTPQSIRLAVENGVKGIEHGNLMDKETAEFMAKNSVWLTPTLVTYSQMAQSDGFLPPESKVKNDEVLRAGLTSLRIASDAGVTMCYGTDLLGPLTAAETQEFKLRSEVLKPLPILQSATVNPARMLGQEEKLGQIQQGFFADLLVLNANPLEDITVLDKPDKHLLATVKDGRVVASRWSKLDVSAASASATSIIE
jgi:imidazolonepropionase-like amidohydrolase